PLAPDASGDIARALATNVAMSSAVDDLVSGSEPALPVVAAELISPGLGLVGSPVISARELAASSMWAGIVQGSMCRQCAVNAGGQFANGCQFVMALAGGLPTGTKGETGPGSLIFATAALVSTGATELSVSVRNLSSMSWIDD